MNGSRSGPGAVLMVLFLSAAAVAVVQAALGRPGVGPDLTHATMLALMLQIAALGVAAALPLHDGGLDLSLGATAMLGVVIGVFRSGGAESSFPLTLAMAVLAGCLVGALGGMLVGEHRSTALVTAIVGGAVLFGVSRVDRHLAVLTAQRLTLLEASAALLGVAVVGSVLITSMRGRETPAAVRVLALAVAGVIGCAAGAMMAAQGVRDAGFTSLSLFLVVSPLVCVVVGGQLALPRESRLRIPAAVAGSLLTAAVCVGSSQPSDNLVPGLVFGAALAVLAAVLWALVLRRRSPFSARGARQRGLVTGGW